MVQGGSFKSGFTSGFTSSFFSPGTELGGEGTGGFTLRTSIAAIIGGTASKVGGGKFSNGAVSAAFVHMFNAEDGLSLTKRFLSGESGEFIFSAADTITKDLMSDPRLRRGISLWKNTNSLKVGNYGFVDIGTFFPIEKGGLNLSLQFIGNYRASIYITGSNEATIYIFNSTSWKSALFHLIPNAVSNKLNSIKQHYWWKESLK